MIDRVTGDAEHETEAIGITQRRAHTAGLHRGDHLDETLLLSLERGANVGPSELLLVADIEPVFACDDEGFSRLPVICVRTARVV